MERSEFANITRDCKDLTFRQIWEIYDSQFSELRDAIMALGDKFVVETFTGTGNQTLHLEHKYKTNHTVVYINDVIQWKGVDYIETDSQTITILNTLSSKDVIKVVIILTSMLVNESELIYSKIQEIVDEKLESIVSEKLFKIIDEEIEDYLELRGFLAPSGDDKVSYDSDESNLYLLRVGSHRYNENTRTLNVGNTVRKYENKTLYLD